MNEATKQALEEARGHKKDILRQQVDTEKFAAERLDTLRKYIAALKSDIEDLTETLGDGNGLQPR